ncbi:MAG: 3-hydroxyacyl-ACP dehydratase FabZ family protein [Thermoguttaceae bacterium]
MKRKEFLVEPSLYDQNKPIADITEIRKYNPQRFEMEQLTAILYDDFETKSCVGYKDTSHEDFWVRGHMPNFALMPGVLICEAAAQMASFFVGKHGLFGGAMVGLAGLEDARFRGMVIPGKRLIIQAQMINFRKKFVSAKFQGLIDEDIICEGVIKGFPIDPGNDLQS